MGRYIWISMEYPIDNEYELERLVCQDEESAIEQENIPNLQ